MGMMINRRRACGRKESQEYIQDGLIFWLDGIDKGTVENSWVDLIEGTIFQAAGNVTFNNDNVLFSGGMCYASRNIPANPSYTIEVCFCPTSSFSGTVFKSGASSNTCLLYLDEGLFLDNYKAYALNKIIGNNTVSLHLGRGFQNGTQVYLSDIIDHWANGSYFTVGCNGHTTGRLYYYGKIYSIRIYNRRLSSEEQLNNQRIDNVRFNLGLNI